MDRVMCVRKRRAIILSATIRNIVNMVGMFYTMVYVRALIHRKKYQFKHEIFEIYGNDRANGDAAIDTREEEDVISANIHSLDDDNVVASEGLQGIDVSSTPSTTSRTKGTKRQKTDDGFNTSLGDMASFFKKLVECTTGNLDKLADGLYINHEIELGKKVVEELSNMEGLDEEDVIKAASIIIGDGPKCSLLLALKPSQKMTWVLKLIGKLPSS